MKIIYLAGEPGSGKTTLMKRIMEHYKVTSDPIVDSSFPLLPFHKNADNVFVWGKYLPGEVFSGTDKTSMAVQPEAIKWLEAYKDKDIVILAEGDRLFTNSFMEHCEENYDLNIYYLRTSEEVRKERYKERGSEQNETWLAGRVTKIHNILNNFSLMGCIKRFDNNNLDDQNKIFECIKKEVE